MNYTGTIFYRVESSLATVTIVDTNDWSEVSVVIGAKEIVKFPLPLGLDADLIASKIGNVINQTGLIDYPVRVELFSV